MDNSTKFILYQEALLAMEKINFSGRKNIRTNGHLPNNHIRNHSILNQFGPFNRQQIELFAGPLRAFWGNFDYDSHLPPINELVSVERNAILAIGTENDMRELFICRKKILESIKFTEVGDDYINLLLTFGKAYFLQRDFASAQNALTPIIAVDQENWHALKELAVVQGVRGSIESALLHFEQARKALGKYKLKIEVAEEEEWEAAVFEARFKLISVLNKDSNAPKEVLFQILKPIFENSENFNEEFYSHNLATIIDFLNKKEIPWETTAYVFGKKVEGERERRHVINEQEIGPIPDRLMVVLPRLAETVKLQELFKTLNQVEKNLGKKAIGLYAWLKIEELLSEENLDGWKEAKWLRDKIKSFVTKPVCDAINNNIKAMGREARQKAKTSIASEKATTATQKVSQNLALIREGKLFLMNDSQRIAKELKEAFRIIKEGERKEQLRNEIANAITSLFKSPSQIKEAVFVSIELWGIEEALQQRIKSTFETALKQEKIKEKVLKMLGGIWYELSKTAEALANKKYAPRYTLSSNSIPEPENFKFDGPEIYNFFFIHLRDLKVIREIFREITKVPYAEPVSFRSNWFEMLANFAKTPQLQLNLLKKSLAEDKNNSATEIEICRLLGISGKINESQKRIREILEKTNDSFFRTKAISIYITNIYKQIEKLVRDALDRNAIQSKIQKKVSQAKEAFSQIEEQAMFAISKSIHLQSDWITVLKVLGRMHSWIRDFEAALGYYDQILELETTNQKAVLEKGAIFLLQGMPLEAINFLNHSLKESNGKILIFYNLLAEAFLQIEDFPNALNCVNPVLRGQPKNLNFLLTKARILAIKRKIEEAQIILGKAERLVNEEFSKGTPEIPESLQGEIELVRAEILNLKNEREKTINSFRQAIQYFSKDPFSEYKEMLARTRLAYTLAKWAEQDWHTGGKAIKGKVKDLFEKSLKQARILVNKFPFSAYSHEVIVGTLISLNQENEALQHLRWFEERLGTFTPELFANLIILASDHESKVQEEAKTLLQTFKDKMQKEVASDLFQEFERAANKLVKDYRSSVGGEKGVLEKIKQFLLKLISPFFFKKSKIIQ